MDFEVGKPKLVKEYTTHLGPVKIFVKWDYDEYYELDWLGEYIPVQDMHDGDIYVDLKKFYEDVTDYEQEEYYSMYCRTECAAFRPYAGGLKPGQAEYRGYALGDLERMEQFRRNEVTLLGIQAYAEVVMPSGIMQKMGSSSMWGIESDLHNDQVDQYEKEFIDELNVELTALGLHDTSVRPEE